MKRHILQIEQVSKTFNGQTAVDRVSFALDEGQILCLLGPSGCGKTTLLRAIAGLETPDAGRVLFDGRDLSHVPPHRRDFGLMFQEFALFPHKNVGQNVAFGLEMKKEVDLTARVAEMLELVGLTGFAERDISNLSGGERQRVALARSLAPNPRLLMLDEPLGSLDRALRERLMLEIRQILKQVGLTAIYVTHDQTEAFAVADRIIVMNRGHLEQDSTPEQLYRQPATPFVAKFLGFTNVLEATGLPEGRLKTPLGIWPVSSDVPPGAPVTILIRPEAASLEPRHDIVIEGEVAAVTFRGRFYQLTISAGDAQLIFELSLAELSAVGSKIRLYLNPKAISVLQSSQN